jgi:hypothetical protein
VADINIPGDQIESARDNMRQVMNLLDSSTTSLSNIDQALGNDKVTTDAAQNFDDRWSDGRTQLKDEGNNIADSLDKVIQAFTDTDNQTGGELTGGSGS